MSLTLLCVSCKDQKIKESKPSKMLNNTVKIIDSPTLGKSRLPYLFTAQDSLYLNWVEQSKDSAYLKLSSLKDSTWSTPQVIASGANWFINWADYPKVIKNNSNYLAAFLQKSDTGTYTYDVNYTTKLKDSSWQPQQIVHSDSTKSEHGFVSLLPYDKNYFITWLDGRKTVAQDPKNKMMTLRGAVIDTLGYKIADYLLDGRVCDCCQTSASMLPSGPVVFYRDRSDSEIRDIYAVRWQDDSWSSPEPVYKDNWEIHGCPVNGPSSSSFKNTIGVGWYTGAQNKPKVQLVFSTNAGASYETPIRVDRGNPAGRVDIALVNEQSAIISWIEMGKDNDYLLARRIDSDGARGKIVEVAKISAGRNSGFPQLEILKNTVFFAWTKNKDKGASSVIMAKTPLQTFLD